MTDNRAEIPRLPSKEAIDRLVWAQQPESARRR